MNVSEFIHPDLVTGPEIPPGTPRIIRFWNLTLGKIENGEMACPLALMKQHNAAFCTTDLTNLTITSLRKHFWRIMHYVPVINALSSKFQIRDGSNDSLANNLS